MKAMWPAEPAILGALILSGCLVVEATVKEAQIPQPQNAAHASLVAYPNAVISVKDTKTGMLFYVESNGRRLVSFDSDGRVVWSVDVIAHAKAKTFRGQPVIRDLRLQGDYLSVTYGKSETARVQIQTGKAEYIGTD
jgi:hypothetical protein